MTKKQDSGVAGNCQSSILWDMRLCSYSCWVYCVSSFPQWSALGIGSPPSFHLFPAFPRLRLPYTIDRWSDYTKLSRLSSSSSDKYLSAIYFLKLHFTVLAKTSLLRFQLSKKAAPFLCLQNLKLLVSARIPVLLSFTFVTCQGLLFWSMLDRLGLG